MLNSLWIVEILLGLAVIFCGNWALKKFIHRYQKGAAATQRWRFELDQIIFVPMRLILWVLGIAYAMHVLTFHFGIFESAAFFSHVQNASIVFALAWMALRWKKIAQAHFLLRHSAKQDIGTLHHVFKIGTFAIIVLAALIILQIFGVNIMPLLAFGGIGAAAIGFAAKDVIANFFGGFMLILNRSFIEGDEIALSQEGIDGIVEKIGWYMTTVRDKNKCPLYLPNAIFTKAIIVNRTRRSHRCIEERLDIAYEDASRIPLLTESLQEMLRAHPDVDASQPIIIGVEAFGDYALQVYLKVYTHLKEEAAFTRARHSILLQIQNALENQNIDMPFPTQAITITSPLAAGQAELAEFNKG